MPVILSDSDIRSRIAAENDGDLAEPVRLLPQAGGAKDPARSNHEFAAKLRVGEVSPEQIGTAVSWKGFIQSGKARLWVTRETYAGPEIRQGDLIVALSRDGEPVWTVEMANDRNKSRIICELSEA
ncbi:hypothetical protein [uncultured Cohaesibacter sp.]|uniref:hypothetical protein n=1 Tax=uncultured Cohaesibacter sp. TaxID=1002546 RepID=UPI0029C8A3ED|nr:hypothetical protein [uncultured Cohaesibacter sp.]